MKKLFILFALFVALGVNAQADLKSVYNAVSDTVTDTGTQYLQIETTREGQTSTAVQVVITKISGTVAGTLTFQGSLDGTNFKAATLLDSATNLHTFTATNVASQNFIWYIRPNPYRYVRVSYTGSGTMAASFKAKILTR